VTVRAVQGRPDDRPGDPVSLSPRPAFRPTTTARSGGRRRAADATVARIRTRSAAACKGVVGRRRDPVADHEAESRPLELAEVHNFRRSRVAGTILSVPIGNGKSCRRGPCPEEVPVLW
jgi:hypothetical protein